MKVYSFEPRPPAGARAAGPCDASFAPASTLFFRPGSSNLFTLPSQSGLPKEQRAQFERFSKEFISHRLQRV